MRKMCFDITRENTFCHQKEKGPFINTKLGRVKGTVCIFKQNIEIATQGKQKIKETSCNVHKQY